MNDIKVKDATEPKEVVTKKKRWFNGMHTFSSLKVNTPEQPTSLSINVGDTARLGEKIG